MNAFPFGVSQYGADQGVRLALEPLNPILMNVDTFLCTIAQAMRVVESVDHPHFGLFIDVWHIWEDAASVSKGGLTTMTRNLADSHGTEGIRVNQFNVGWTLTPNEFELKKKEGLPDDWPTKIPKTYAPSGRLLSPEDIAWAAVYFLSDEAALINGAILDLEQYPHIEEAFYADP